MIRFKSMKFGNSASILTEIGTRVINLWTMFEAARFNKFAIKMEIGGHISWTSGVIYWLWKENIQSTLMRLLANEHLTSHNKSGDR